MVKEIKIMKIKQSKNIKHGSKAPNFNAMFNNTIKDLEKHQSTVIFGVRFAPTLVWIVIIYLIV